MRIIPKKPSAPIKSSSLSSITSHTIRSPIFRPAESCKKCGGIMPVAPDPMIKPLLQSLITGANNYLLSLNRLLTLLMQKKQQQCAKTVVTIAYKLLDWHCNLIAANQYDEIKIKRLEQQIGYFIKAVITNNKTNSLSWHIRELVNKIVPSYCPLIAYNAEQDKLMCENIQSWLNTKSDKYDEHYLTQLFVHGMAIQNIHELENKAACAVQDKCNQDNKV